MTQTKGPVEQALEQLLIREFAPSELKIFNQSHHHASHASSPGTGESHFLVHIKSDQFAGLPPVRQHQLVMRAAAELLKNDIHALSLKTSA